MGEGKLVDDPQIVALTRQFRILAAEVRVLDDRVEQQVPAAAGLIASERR